MNKITYWRWRTRDWYYALKNGIKSLWKWIPVIWEDRDWDHNYMYRILRAKLKFMIDSMNRGHRWVGREQEIRHIKLIINRIDFIVDDKSYDARVGWDKHQERWGKSSFRFEDVDGQDGYKTLHIDRANVKTEEDKKLERRQFRKLMEREEMLQAQDLDYIHKLMKKHSKKWWI